MVNGHKNKLGDIGEMITKMRLQQTIVIQGIKHFLGSRKAAQTQ